MHRRERLTKITYDALNRKETVTDPMNNITRYDYMGSTTGCSTCKGGSTEIPAAITDPLGNVTNLTFDENGKVTGVKDPLNNVTNIGYNAVGKVVSRTDANGNMTQYEYDATGKVTKQIDANGGAIVFTYDTRGNLKTLTDQNNHTTTFVYDHADRKIREIRPMGQTTEYSYYPSGLLHTITDAKGQVTTYVYDTAKRLTEIDYADGKLDTFGYDAAGNMVSYLNSSVTGTIIYDDLNRKTSEIVNFGTFTKTYSYSYNTTGNKATYTSPEGVTYTYGYNKNNQPTSIVFGTQTIGFDYVWQQQRKTTLPNGVTTDYHYNPASWLDDINVKKMATSLANSHYLFDNIGNITGKSTEQGSHGYGYDPLYQLTSATHPVLPAEAYSYDGVGNRQTSTSGAVQMSYGHNGNNELVSFGTATVAYDANGNTTRTASGSDITTYIYNATNRMERVELPDGRTAIYKYDPFGRRVSKTVDNQTTYFMYADEGLVGEYGESGTFQKAYGWQPDSTWGTNPVFMVENGQYYYYHNDHLATPQKMTDSAGVVRWSADYKPFGEATVTVSTITNNLRFPGQYFDAEVGLHYNYFRDYNPVIGRYIEKDPIGVLWGRNHLYAYVGNNTTHYVDPLGLWGAGLIVTGSAEVGIVAAGAGGTGSAGVGVFTGPAGDSSGAFASFGSFAGGPGYGSNCPSGASGNIAGGAFAGLGPAGAFFTNATNVNQLAGSFNTYSLNLGIGPQISFQFGYSNGIWIFSGSYGPGVGINFSNYNTNTWTAGGGYTVPGTGYGIQPLPSH